MTQKGGEVITQISLRRSPRFSKTNGLIVSIKSSPQVEDLFRTWGGDKNPIDVITNGRDWMPMEGDSLLAYPLASDPGEIKFEGGRFTINALGGPLQITPKSRRALNYGDPEEVLPGGAPRMPDVYGEVLNLSFLRLVGISEGIGVSFVIKGVWTTEALISIRDQINEATKKLYRSFLKPVDFNIQITRAAETPVYGVEGVIP